MLFKTRMAGINAYRDVMGGRIHKLVEGAQLARFVALNLHVKPNMSYCQTFFSGFMYYCKPLYSSPAIFNTTLISWGDK